MKEVNFENLTLIELYNTGRELLEELREAESKVIRLKAFCPYILEENYNKLSYKEQCKFCVISHFPCDTTDELKELYINQHLMQNLLNNNEILKTEEKLNQLRKEVKCFNEFIKLKNIF